jgi:hypothetical protein
MRGREAEWTYPLSPREIVEIETAMKAVHARGLDIADIRREDFPLPTLGPVLDRLRAEVLDGRGFALLRGMPVEDRPIAESAKAYWGVGTYFGSARSQNAQGHLLGHVYDLDKGLSATNPNLRSYATQRFWQLATCRHPASVESPLRDLAGSGHRRASVFKEAAPIPLSSLPRL